MKGKERVFAPFEIVSLRLCKNEQQDHHPEIL
jgi:hypothetical protein